MTQYVATRWYRAPELIVASHQGYGAAIDMWSVGCIFAEMLRRKHLFPGRNLVDQLGVIIRTLGIPSKKYLQNLDSENVCALIRSRLANSLLLVFLLLKFTAGSSNVLITPYQRWKTSSSEVK